MIELTKFTTIIDIYKVPNSINYLDVQTLILLKLFEIGIDKFIKNILIVTLFNSGL